MKRWYVVQVYAGYEETVKADLEKRIQEAGLQDSFGEILIPAIKYKQFFEFEETKDQQLFPGYMLIEMDMAQQSMRLVLSSLRVIKFLGGMQPVPLSSKEINKIISQVKGEISVGPEQAAFSIGNEVEIKEGPFAGFVGVVDKIDYDNERLAVMVSIFGRMTPVEIGFDQVKR